MPLFESGRDFQFNNSIFTDVGRDNNNYYGSKQTALSMLESRVAAGAFHNSSERFDPPKCHPETRVAVLNRIRDWYKNGENALAPCIMWLYGPAGAGKSAIAQTMAEECHVLSTLAASFFFSRTAPGRNDATRLVSTISYQVAQYIPGTQPHIQQALENDPMIFSRSLDTQFRQLVVQPILAILPDDVTVWPKLIIIDGLDECGDGPVQQAVVHSLASTFIQHRPPLRVLILSRPEQPIRQSFSRSDRRGAYVSLVLDDNFQPAKDIALFLRKSFDEIRETHDLKSHIPVTWPLDDDIETLVRKSSGQFIFSSTVIRYVKSPRHRPMDRLQRVLGIGSREDPTPFAELDALYMHILLSTDKAQHSTILRIFGFLLCQDLHYISQPSQIEDFLNLRRGDLDLALADCHSIISLSPSSADTNRTSLVYFLHASMEDFLIDPARSHRFFVDQGSVHAELARACMKGISSSYWEVGLYSSQSLPRHTKNAHLDEELLQDLLRFNLSNLFPVYDACNMWGGIKPTPPWYHYRACLDQVSWVKEQVLGGSFGVAPSLLERHLRTLDHRLKRQLLTFTWPDRVPQLHALADKIKPTSRARFSSELDDHRVPDTWKHACLLLDLDICDAYKTDPNTHHFVLCTSFTYEDAVVMEELYLDFLRDRDRAGKYHINPIGYARIALHCINYICTTPHEHDFAREDSESDAGHNYRTCNLGFAALPSILSSAGPLKKLADSLRSGKSSCWMEISDARAEYLQKYDSGSQDRQEDESDQENEENPKPAKRPRFRMIEPPEARNFTQKSVQRKGKQATRKLPWGRARRDSTGPSETSGEEELPWR